MFKLKSAAFKDEGKIPKKYAEESSTSPPLNWDDIPKGTKSLALAMTDPDVPEVFEPRQVFVHWIVYNIPPSVTSLPDGASPGGKLPSGAKELNNDTGTTSYFGPWPPDAAHRYVFTLFALRVPALVIPEGADYAEFGKAVLPQTIATAKLIGYYGPAKAA
jgi:ribose transport system ATP-binding protein